MANPEHLKILEQGVEVWNEMWVKNPQIRPNLVEADLSGMNLEGIILNNAQMIMTNFSDTNLQDAKISHANLLHAKLEGANFERAQLHKTNLSYAKLELKGVNFGGAELIQSIFSNVNLKNSNFDNTHLVAAQLWNAELEGSSFVNADLNRAEFNKANLKNTNFSKASLRGADLTGVNFTNATLNYVDFTKARLNDGDFSGAKMVDSDLSLTSLVDVNLSNAILKHTRIYGISAWNIKKDGLIQKDLIITPPGEPEITVDDLEVAQFIYFMLNNQKIRDVIETITSKTVLILGRFSEERKKVLDALKDELRRRNYLPIVFDFQNTSGKSLNETMGLLARMSRFVIADITDARAIREELALVIPQNPSIPVVPLVLKGQEVYSTFDFPQLYKSVLPLHEYESPEILLGNIIPAIITPAEQKVAELRRK